MESRVLRIDHVCLYPGHTQENDYSLRALFEAPSPFTSPREPLLCNITLFCVEVHSPHSTVTKFGLCMLLSRCDIIHRYIPAILFAEQCLMVKL